MDDQTVLLLNEVVKNAEMGKIPSLSFWASLMTNA